MMKPEDVRKADKLLDELKRIEEMIAGVRAREATDLTLSFYNNRELPSLSVNNGMVYGWLQNYEAETKGKLRGLGVDI